MFAQYYLITTANNILFPSTNIFQIDGAFLNRCSWFIFSYITSKTLSRLKMSLLCQHFCKPMNSSFFNKTWLVIVWKLHFSVGGIYTVIRSKAYVSTEEMGEQYCMIGPYKETCARTEVEQADYPQDSPLYKAVQVMRDHGYKVRKKHQVQLSILRTWWNWTWN